MTNKLTDRMIYTAILENTVDSIDADALAAWAEKKIDQLDRKAVKAKETAAKKRAEGDALTEAVFEATSDEFESIATIAERIEGEDVTVSKVSYRLNAMTKGDNPRLEKGEIAIEGEGKKRRVVAYRRLG